MTLRPIRAVAKRRLNDTAAHLGQTCARVSAAQRPRIIALPAGPNVIRMLPPLVIEKAQIDQVVAVLREILK